MKSSLVVVKLVVAEFVVAEFVEASKHRSIETTTRKS